MLLRADNSVATFLHHGQQLRIAKARIFLWLA
jgi:hypothetical protein